MCSAVISARLRMRLAAKLRRRCSCPTFFCLWASLSAAAPPAQFCQSRTLYFQGAKGLDIPAEAFKRFYTSACHKCSPKSSRPCWQATSKTGAQEHIPAFLLSMLTGGALVVIALPRRHHISCRSSSCRSG